MGFAKLYTFKVFFKTWLVILFFGILNGIILLPILLSMVGPVEVQEPIENSQEELDQELGKKQKDGASQKGDRDRHHPKTSIEIM